MVGERLKQLRESKYLSQGDIEQRTGLLRCYISRVENGHTVPSIETLEKLARSMDVQLFEFFGQDGNLPKGMKSIVNTEEFRQDKHIRQLETIFPKLSRSHRAVVVELARKLSKISKVSKAA